MKLRPCRLCLLAATVAATAWAQTAPPAPAATTPRVTPPRSASQPAKPARPGKTGVPDPDLLDGSAFEKEKRPNEGMLSEIEMGENEGAKGEKISPNSGQPAANQSGMQLPGIGVGIGSTSSEQPAASTPGVNIGISASQPPDGPPSQEGGIKVADLKVPEGAQSAGGGAQSKSPRDQQIGDATLQIPDGKSAPDVVGTQSSSAQQYEKKLPAGGAQTDNRNRGVEKGRVVPKGL